MTTTTRLDEIQLLRAVAALAVVAQHLPLVRNGAWGVDVFFAISGFIMCFVTERGDPHFLVKRVIRIVPLYWASTLGLFVVGAVVPGLPAHVHATVRELLLSLAFIPFPRGDSVHPVLFLGWTLNSEMLFYALFAVAMRVDHARRAIVCGALLVVVVVAGALVPLSSVAWRFWTAPLHLEFAFGMAIYALSRPLVVGARAEQARGARPLLVVVGLAMLVVLPLATDAVAVVGRTVAWGIPAAILVFVTVVGLHGARLPRAVVAVGDASFSLYLLHPYVIELVERALAKVGVVNDGALAAITGATASVLVALLVYALVEKPVTAALRRRLTDRARPPTSGTPDEPTSTEAGP